MRWGFAMAYNKKTSKTSLEISINRLLVKTSIVSLRHSKYNLLYAIDEIFLSIFAYHI